MASIKRYVVGISGASGIVLGFKLVRKLLEETEGFVHLIVTRDARYTALEELNRPFPHDEAILGEFDSRFLHRLSLEGIQDFGSPVASGTYLTHGMVVVPCSMATLAAISIGLSDNLLRRAADVTLKEKRPLIIVPRESPFSSIHLQHMLSLSQQGVRIIVPQPAWYTHPQTIEDVEDHIVGRILDSMGVHIDYRRWTGGNCVKKREVVRDEGKILANPSIVV